MELGASWDGNSRWPSQDFVSVLWKQKVKYTVLLQSPKLASVLKHMTLIYFPVSSDLSYLILLPLLPRHQFKNSFEISYYKF